MKLRKHISNFWYLVTYHFVRTRIKVTKASFSGDGSFIDVRYWVSRPDKINPKTSPYLMTAQNQKLGLMHIAKFGAIKSKVRKHTNTGILLFYNKNKAVSIGDKITLHWEGLIAKDVEVK